jgi:hypothetical protein
MSKLAHSNQTTMDEIERKRMLEDNTMTRRHIMGRTQWFDFGDHPAVRRPTEAHLQPVPGMKNVGIITTTKGEVMVREGDWIVTYEDGDYVVERAARWR